MALPTIRQSGVVSGTSVNLGAGTLIGDTIVIVQFLYGQGLTPVAATTPTGSGWTTLNNTALGTGVTKYWWKLADVAGAQTITCTPQNAANSGTYGQGLAYFVLDADRGGSGVAANPIDGSSFGSTATAPAAAITRPEDDIILGFFGNGHGTGSARNLGPPTGMTEVGEITGSMSSFEACYQIGMTAGATTTGTKAVTNSSGSTSGGLIVITGQRLIIKSGSTTTTLGLSGSSTGQKHTASNATTSTLGGTASATGRKAVARTQAAALALSTSSTGRVGRIGATTSALALTAITKRIFGTVQSLGIQSTVTGRKAVSRATTTTLGTATANTGLHLGQLASVSPLTLTTTTILGGKKIVGAVTVSALNVGSPVTAYITGGQPPPDPSQEIQTRIYVPPQNQPTRYIVQDILTGQIRDWDLPLSDVEITFNLSGSTVLRGSIGPEYREVREIQLDAWASWIHVEEGGQIRASAIVQPLGISDENLDVEAVGFTAYPHGIPFQSELSLIDADPVQIVRLIWVHLLSFPDAAMSITMDPTASPIKLGTGPKTVPVLTEAGEQAYDIVTETNSDTGDVTEISRTAKTQDIEAKPYELNWYDDKDCGSEIDTLAKSTPFDYAERVDWNAGKTGVLHHLRIGYPRLGTRRFDLRFAEDENLLQVVTALETPDHYASQVIVRGSGEGRDAIRAYAGSRDVRRLRRIATVVDRSLTDGVMASAMAGEELRRRISVTEFSDIVIDATHDNAPMGSWNLGDDILVQCNIPYIGEVSLWHRIIAYTWRPDSDVVTINLKRSEQFAYGELAAAIGGSRSSEPEKDYVIGEDTTSNTDIDPTPDDGSTGGGTGGTPGSPGTIDTATAAGKLGWGTPLSNGDEFDTDGAPDSSKWSVYNGPGHSGNGKRLPARVTISGGKMILTGLANGDSAGLAHKLNQKYGRWECRVRSFSNGTSNGNDYSPVLIIWPQSDRWPDDGEYDFMEPGAVGGTTAGAYIHYPSATVKQEHATKPGVDMTQFHNFAIDWQATGIKGYIDGVEWFNYSAGGIQNMPSGHLTVQLDNFDGTSQTPGTMEVEWVRIYTATGSGPSYTPGTATPGTPDPDPNEPGTGTGGGTTVQRKVGVGGIAKGSDAKTGVGSTSTWSITSAGTYDGEGRTVGRIDVKGSNIIVQNYNIVANSQYGVLLDGSNNTLQNCKISGIKASGDGDLNAITVFGPGHKILYNEMIDFVSGDPGGSHTDGIQTWVSSSHSSAAKNVEVIGNVMTGPSNPSRSNSVKSIHQCIMAEGANASGSGNSGGSGNIDGWKVLDNTFGDSWNQSIKVNGGANWEIARNKFVGSSDKVFDVGNTSGMKIYTSNQFGSGYGSVGATTTSGDGPANPYSTTTSGGGSTGGGSTGGGSTGGGTTTGTSPGQLLKIGSTGGYWNIGIGLRGGSHTDYSQSQITGGFTKAGYFELNPGKTAVLMTAYMDGGRTSANTNYARSELRELKSDGTAKAAWSAASGTHVMSGSTKVIHVAPNRPNFCLAQIHDAEDDILQIRLQGANMVVNWLGQLAAGTLQSNYQIGTEFSWKIEVVNKVCNVYYNGEKKFTKSYSGTGNYFKVGAYAQSNSSYDDSDEYMSCELRNLVTTHS